MAKRIMCIGAGKYQLPAIIKARQMGLEVVATDYDSNCPGREHADYFEAVDVKDIEQNLSVAKRYGVEGVISIVSELGVKTASQVAEQMGLPGLNTNSADIVTNKLKMKRLLAAAGIPVARFMGLRNLNDMEEVVPEIGLPFVLKPVDNAGSRGVIRVDKVNDIEPAFNLALKNSFCGELIAEEFIKGCEFTVEAITYNNRHSILAMSEKKRIPFPHCVSIDLTYPPSVEVEVQQRIRNLVYEMLNIFGIDNGPTHTEVMVTENNQLYIIETAGRGGGYGVFSDIIRLVSGVDAVKECVNMAVGYPVELNQKFSRAAVLRFFTPPCGKLVEIRNLKEAEGIEGVHTLEIFVKEGEYINPIVSDGTRPGMVITHAEDRKEAVSIADRAEETIEFRVSKED